MYLLITLFIGWITGIIIEVTSKSYDHQSNNLTVAAFFGIAIIIPIIEESVFRCTFPYLFGDLFDDEFYFQLINAVLFGLAHIFNWFLHYNMWKTLYQVVITSVLGWYLIDQHSLKHAMIIHMLYNTLTILVVKIILLIKEWGLESDEKSVALWLSYDKLRPSKSLTNFKQFEELELNVNNSRYVYQDVKLSSLPKEVQISINKYDSIRINKSMQKAKLN